MFVVGEKDRDDGHRRRSATGWKATWAPMPLDAAIAKLRAEIDAKTVRQVAERQAVAAADRGDSQNEY